MENNKKIDPLDATIEAFKEKGYRVMRLADLNKYDITLNELSQIAGPVGLAANFLYHEEKHEIIIIDPFELTVKKYTPPLKKAEKKRPRRRNRHMPRL